MTPATIADLLCRVLILLIVFPAHELAHAVIATRFGDPTPRLKGRLTLNPFKHLDPWGSILFILVGIGWASTPINPAYFGEHRRMKMGLVALSGPLVNLALVVLGTVPFYFFGWTPTFTSSSLILPAPAYFFTMFIFLNLLLTFWNLVPFAPLDGAQVLGAVIPESWVRTYDSAQRYGFYIIIVLFFVLPMIDQNLNILNFFIAYLVAPIMQLLFLGVP
jgi:Zn-dependent protease